MVHLTPISAVFNTYSKAKDLIFFGLSEAKSSMIFFLFCKSDYIKITFATWGWDTKPKKFKRSEKWRKFKSFTSEYVLNTVKMGTDHWKDKCNVNVYQIQLKKIGLHSHNTYPSNGLSPSLLYSKHILKLRIWIEEYCATCCFHLFQLSVGFPTFTYTNNNYH